LGRQTLNKGKGGYELRGKIERVDDTTLVISELPVKVWTQTYKEFLTDMLVVDKEKEKKEQQKKDTKGKKTKESRGKEQKDSEKEGKTAEDSKSKKTPDLQEIRENHTETTVSFTLISTKDKIDEFESSPGGLYGKFKLTSKLSATNMVLFGSKSALVKYSDPLSILDEFYILRLVYYEKRKASLIKKLELEKMILSNKARFVEEVCAGDLIVSNRKRKEILADLQTRGYDLVSKDAKKDEMTSIDEEEESDTISADDEPSTAALAKGFEYLLGMKIWSLTYEKATELRAQLQEKTHELDILFETEPAQIWLDDLELVEQALGERDKAFSVAMDKEKMAQKKAKNDRAKGKKKATNNKKKNAWSSDTEDDEKLDENSVDSLLGFQRVKKKSIPKKKPIATIAVATKPSNADPKHTKRAPSPPSPPSDSEDSVDLTMSLSQRLKKNLVVSPPAKAMSSVNAGFKKRRSPRESDIDEDGFLSEGAGQVKPKQAKEKKTAAIPKKKTAATKPKKAPSAAPKKKTVLDYSSDEDLDFSSEDEPVVVVPPPVRAPRAARVTTQSKKTYAFGDSSSDEDEMLSSGEDF
jgi:DNA gyrase/topoisomerase IV subunit A